MHMRRGFGSGRKKFLAALAVVMMAGGAILLIDQWQRGTKPPIDPDVELRQIADQLGMQVVTAESQSARLLPVLQSLPTLGSGELALGEVLYREDDQHALWLLEYQISATLLRNPTSAAFRRHQGELTRLAVVIWRRDAAWANWDGDSLRTPPDTWSEDALERIRHIEDLWISTRGEWLIAHARGLASGLQEMVQRQQSTEFQPGLRNSALPVDAQRVVDVANLLSPELPELPRVYQIAVDVKLPEVGKPDLSARLQAIREEQAVKRAAMRAEIDARNTALREKIAADNAALEQRMRQRSTASSGTEHEDVAPAPRREQATGSDRN